MPQLIIDDVNYVQWQNGDAFHCGGEARVMGTLPRKSTYGALPFAGPPAIPLIPRSEWPDRIADLSRRKMRLRDKMEAAGLKIWDQDGYGFCHGYSAVKGCEVQRMEQGLPHVNLSASSVAAPAAGWQNAGAAIDDDLKEMVETGVATIDFVPMLTHKKSLFKEGWKENAALHRVIEVWDLQSRNFDQQATCMLAGFGVCNGLNYWGHAVFDHDLVDYNPKLPAEDLNRYGVEFANSWTANWGDKGHGIRVGSKKFADQAYVIRQVKASAA